MPTSTSTTTLVTPRPTGSRRAMRVVAPLAVFVALGTATAGCGGSDDVANSASDKIAEQLAEAGAGDGADVNIDSDNGQLDISSDDGSMSFGDQTELPEDFPSDIPLPSDYELTSSMSMGGGNSDGWSISGTLTDASSATFDDLVAGFTDAGWTKSSEATNDTGDGTTATAMLTSDSWQVVVSIQFGFGDMSDSFTYVVSPTSS